MSETGIDYSKYSYKISELKRVDWDGLHFTINFVRPLNEEEKRRIKTKVNEWFNKGLNSTENPFHFIDDFKWPNKYTLKWWVDLGNSESSALELLLQEFDKEKDIIKEVVLGRNPQEGLSGKDLPSRKTADETRIDYLGYPYRISETRWHDYDSLLPFTVIFVRSLDEGQKKQIEDMIYGFFTKGKKNVDEIKYFLGVKWADSQTVGWWTDPSSLLELSTLKLLLQEFVKYKDIIEEFIIGSYLKKLD